MSIDKEQQNTILQFLNDVLRKKRLRGTAYLFGGSSLISQDLLGRTTEDIDLFLILKQDSQETIELIRSEVAKAFGVEIDIGLRGEFPIVGKNFTWVLPETAYGRAIQRATYSNLIVYALHPLDIAILKCDRLNDQDQEDLQIIFRSLHISREQLIKTFEEYHARLKGNTTSIENIRENFYQLTLTIYDIVMNKKT